jgi:hypothetical protein
MVMLPRFPRTLFRDSILLALLGVFAAPIHAQEESAFPPDDPALHGIAPEALARLSTFAKGVVDSGEIVGCEIAVIHKGRTLSCCTRSERPDGATRRKAVPWRTARSSAFAR